MNVSKKKPEVIVFAGPNNAGKRPFRIFKKRKTQIYYDECVDWYFEDISMLTGIRDMERKKLNGA